MCTPPRFEIKKATHPDKYNSIFWKYVQNKGKAILTFKVGLICIVSFCILLFCILFLPLSFENCFKLISFHFNTSQRSSKHCGCILGIIYIFVFLLFCVSVFKLENPCSFFVEILLSPILLLARFVATLVQTFASVLLIFYQAFLFAMMQYLSLF